MRGGGSKAVWNFSENSSVLELLGFPKFGFLQMVLPMFGYSHDHGFLWFGVAPLAWPWPWLSIYRGGALYHIAMQSKNL